MPLHENAIHTPVRGVSLDPADPDSRAAERFIEEVAPLLRD